MCSAQTMKDAGKKTTLKELHLWRYQKSSFSLLIWVIFILKWKMKKKKLVQLMAKFEPESDRRQSHFFIRRLFQLDFV